MYRRWNPADANIRQEIQRQVRQKTVWEVNADTLTDRSIIRRMALKRCIYGVDLNPLAVELAKMSLWLHSFTVGAPLTFLDHHLRCGDSLVGGWLAQTAEDIQAAGGAFANYAFAGMTTAARGIHAKIEQIDDADISDVKESASLFEAMQETVEPIRRMLNFGSPACAGWRRATMIGRWLSDNPGNCADRSVTTTPPLLSGGCCKTTLPSCLISWTHGPDALTDAHRQVDGFDFTGFARFIALWRIIG